MTYRRLTLGLLAVATGCIAGTRRTESSLGRRTVRLVLLGQSLIEHDPRGLLDSPLSSLSGLLASGDIVFTNFEGAVKGRGCVCTPTRGDVFQHGSTPEVLDFLAFARVSLLSLANNHAWDYDTDGVVSTLAEARARHLVTAGTGRDLREATAPAVIVVRGVRVAMIAMATVRISDSAAATVGRPGVNLLRLDNQSDWDRNIDAIKAATRAADVVIVYHHFQTVGTVEWQRRWAHATIDAGADLYVSHGEPTLAGVELYDGHPVLYDLGNFIFQTRTEPGRYSSDVWESVIAQVDIGRDTVSDLHFTPIILEEGSAGPYFLATRGFPKQANGKRAAAILARVAKLSAAIGTRLDIVGETGFLRIKRLHN